MSINSGSKTKRAPISNVLFSGLAVLLGGVFWLYGMGVMFSVPYFNWNYVEEHGFTRWLFFGEVVATGKALAWPYFAFVGNGGLTKQQKQEMRHLRDARREANGAIVIFTKTKNPGIQDLRDAAKIWQQALAESKLVSDTTLSAVHPELPNQVEIHFRQGIESLIHGVDELNDQLLFKGQRKLTMFDDFWEDHRKEFK